jgi:excinuclease ABC subunit B
MDATESTLMDTLQSPPFSLETAYTPTGDQPAAIDALVSNLRPACRAGALGVTDRAKRSPWPK